MKELKHYKYAIGGLILLNMAMLAFFVITKPKHPRPAPPSNFKSHAVNMLHLNAKQETAFNELAQDHHQKMDVFDKQQQALLLPYFQSLSTSSITIDEEIVLNEIQQLEKEKIRVTYQHFKDLKAMLTDDQLPHFEKLTQEFINHVLLKNKKQTPPPRKHLKH